MDWQSRLISTYLTVCMLWDQGLREYAQRMSRNQTVRITDQELITIFLNGIMMGRHDLKSIFNFASDNLKEWFPDLGTYETFVRRLNQIADVFPVLVDLLTAIQPTPSGKIPVQLLDSMPIIMAKSKRSSSAKVAPERADKGYCGSKDTFYYGVKLHVLGFARPGTIPFPEHIGITKASCNDLSAFRELAPYLNNRDIFADKAYINKEENRELTMRQNVQIATPIKLLKGQSRLNSADQLYSTAVSRIRQPIESFFNWLQEKTGVQAASKVRASAGLVVHVFGRFSAALMLLLNI